MRNNIDIQWTLSISKSQGTKEFVRDRERKLGWNQWKGAEKIVRDREKFEIEGVRDRESPLYIKKRLDTETEKKMKNPNIVSVGKTSTVELM